MKKSIISLFMGLSILASSAQNQYKLISPIPNSQEGDVAYLINFDTGEKVDSATVYEGAVTFKGEIDEPFVVRLLSNGNRFGTFFLEEGTTAVNQTTKRAVGSMLNDMYNCYSDSISTLINQFQADGATEQVIEDAYNKYVELTCQTISENIDNPLGYFVFVDYAYELSPTDFFSFLEKYPELKKYNRVQNLIKTNTIQIETSEGKPFKDFEITYDGTTKRLSDYVGKGHYTLVDFWASWCGPCRKEIKTLKEINKKFKDKGLEILGVAVWDEPENTISAIKNLGITWDCILNTQNIATDIYGIPGIPCIILFAPDGTIVSRGLQGNDLIEAVTKALEK